MLQSEIKGEIKNIEKYFDSANPARLKQLDLLLLTQGWRDYIWKKFENNTIKITYLPESEITLTGMVRQKLGNKPLPNINITMFGNKFTGRKMFSASTDSIGRFFINGLNWTGNQPIRISSHDNKGQRTGWLLLDSVYQDFKLKEARPLVEVEKAADYTYNVEIEKRKAYGRSFRVGETITLNSVNITGMKKETIRLSEQTLKTFGYEDQVLTVTHDDYDFQGLKHFLLTKAKGSIESPSIDSLQIPEGIGFFGQGKVIPATIMLNNKEQTAQTGRLDLMELTMDQVNSVRIKHLVDQVGNDAFLVYLDVKQTAFERATMAVINRDITGYYDAKAFYAPNHGGDKLPLRDLRTTVFWSPLIKTDERGQASVSFFNADPKATIFINAQGITNNGIPVVGTSTYKVQ